MQDILLISTADWDNPFWTNKQHMAALFNKRGYRVLYLDSLGLRRPTFHKRDLKRIAKRLVKALPTVHEVRPNLWRISPLVLPFHSISIVRSFDAALLRAQVKYYLALIGMSRPLIWTYNPVIVELCSKIPNSGIVYHCVDDLGASPRIDPDTIQNAEAKLGNIAQLCFATSQILYERMSTLFPRVIYEPNVCDQAFFETARLNPAEPAELSAIPHPRLLFVGALSEYKINYDLMESIARDMPEQHWILIGPEGEGQPDSRRPPVGSNIHMLGPRTYGHLPYYMAHCEMAVLPIARNSYTDAMFPMKFFEFLAAGLPVICTRIPALNEFESLYFPCDTPEDFQAAITAVLNGARRDQEEIDAACHHHSWEARFTRMEKILEEVFPQTIRNETTPHA